MSDLIFYGTDQGRVFGPYHKDEMMARTALVARLHHQKREVFAISAETYEEARRALTRKLR